MQPELLKRVVVKEELVALTGDFIKAVILNQFIYWSQRVYDFDKFIEEEKTRAEYYGIDIKIEPRNGWIYKSAEELSSETMLNLAHNTIRKHIKYLVDNNWLSQRNNPENKWDRTTQYRVNLIKINQDLLKTGYVLQDYKIQLPFINQKDTPLSKSDNALSENDNALSSINNGMSLSDNRRSNTDNPITITENQTVNNRHAIPESTLKINTDLVVVKEPTIENIDLIKLTFKHKLGVDLPENVVIESLANYPVDYILGKIELCRSSNIKDNAIGFYIKSLEKDYKKYKRSSTPTLSNKKPKNESKKTGYTKSLHELVTAVIDPRQNPGGLQSSAMTSLSAQEQYVIFIKSRSHTRDFSRE